jgi:hypothetical protein
MEHILKRPLKGATRSEKIKTVLDNQEVLFAMITQCESKIVELATNLTQIINDTVSKELRLNMAAGQAAVDEVILIKRLLESKGILSEVELRAFYRELKNGL